MSDTGYLKCACQKCGGSIEFPTSGVGEQVDCPHCGERTTLVSTPAKRGKKYILIAGALLLLSILMVAGVILYGSKPPPPDVFTPVPTTQHVANVAVSNPFTEINDFKIGPVNLKKTAGNGLIYAVGTVKNDTDRQRFGVKVQLDLLDAQDAKIGSASDYLAVMEPHKTWQFRALLTEPKTVTAKLAKIEEQK